MWICIYIIEMKGVACSAINSSAHFGSDISFRFGCRFNIIAREKREKRIHVYGYMHLYYRDARYSVLSQKLLRTHLLGYQLSIWL